MCLPCNSRRLRFVDQPRLSRGRNRRSACRARDCARRRRDRAGRWCAAGVAPVMRQHRQPPRMGPVHRRRESAGAPLRREMADLEDGIGCAGRDRRRIGRVGDLRDEAAVLAERRRQPLPRAGRPLVEDLAQDRLVCGDRIPASRPASGASSIAHAAGPGWHAMAALTRPERAGATESDAQTRRDERRHLCRVAAPCRRRG